MKQKWPKLTPQNLIGIVGAGAMGRGIAEIFAVAGYHVKIFDAKDGAATQAITTIKQGLAQRAAKGKITATAADQAASRLHPLDKLSAIADCALIIEAIIEAMDAKTALFAELEKIVAPEVILASNTSALSITALAAGLEHRRRVIGLHFFNPVPIMPLVEVIAGSETAPDLVEAMAASLEALGKVTVTCSSTPGFIVNRAARPFYGEGFRLLHERVVDVPTLDLLMREVAGFRMGPCELSDLVGQDVNFAVTQALYEGFYQDRRYSPSPLQREMVVAGWLGRKTQRGFYVYDHDQAVSQAAPQAAPQAVSSPPLEADAPPTGGCAPIFFDGSYLEDRLSHAIMARLVANGHAPQTPSIRHTHTKDASVMHIRDEQGRVAVLHLNDGRSATKRAQDNNVKHTLLLDYVHDIATAKRLVISKAASCHPNALANMIRLLRQAGFAVTVVADVPGLVVMRVWAMIINEAAQMIQQGVCDAATLDLALQKGANYPIGPLALADDWGLPRLLNFMRNLRDYYGEERYRTAIWLQLLAERSEKFYG
ncbi:MAG: 3-hydroxyacyl-CoA dehydrogenase [Candidatus Symbiobacter sp.]|nr:3-hydroxyacyl-CoA dehydrogenase [Candidatus Symbiobacter sp.]